MKRRAEANSQLPLYVILCDTLTTSLSLLPPHPLSLSLSLSIHLLYLSLVISARRAYEKEIFVV